MSRGKINKKNTQKPKINVLMTGVTLKFSLFVIIFFAFVAHAKIEKANSMLLEVQRATLIAQERIIENNGRIEKLKNEIYRAKDENKVISRATSALGMYSPKDENVIFVEALYTNNNTKIAVLP